MITDSFKYYELHKYKKEVVILSKAEKIKEPLNLRKPVFDKINDKKFYEEYSEEMGKLKAKYDFKTEIRKEELPFKIMKNIVIGVLFALFILFTVYIIKILFKSLF